MTRYLLDTNILSNATKAIPSRSLIEWMANQPDENLFIASLTLAEIHRGILEKPAGKKRRQLEAWFAGREGPPALFSGRILPFDQKAGLIWAQLMSEGVTSGRPKSALDMIIASTALANDAVVVTDNEKDFPNVNIINPLRSIDVE